MLYMGYLNPFMLHAHDNNKKAIAVFLDFSKAFDIVDHKELLKIMPSFGVINESYKWFTNYLNNRIQKVKTNDNNILRNDQVLNCGVPQGSVLGSVLFIMYINSILCNMHIDGLITMYVHDIS